MTLVAGKDTGVARGILERKGSKIFQNVLDPPKVSSTFGVGRPSVSYAILSSVITCHCLPLLSFPGCCVRQDSTEVGAMTLESAHVFA